MSLEEFVRDIIASEHMGMLASEANIDVTRRRNTVRVYWNSIFEGKVVRQYAEMDFHGICLDICLDCD